MEYLITPPEETVWKISDSDFIDNLLKKWPDTEIHKVTNPDSYYVIEWFTKVSGLGQRLDGALHQDRQGVSLDGNLENCAKFAIWLRSQVPKTQKLVYYAQGYNSYIELQEETTEAEIIKAFVGSVYEADSVSK